MRIVQRTFSGLTIAISAIPIVAFIVLAIVRLKYPYELEWLESGMVEHVRRILHGNGIYEAPTVDFVTFPYGPLSSYLGAAISLPFGAHFWELRLISITSTLGTFYLLAWLVHKETSDWTAGIASAGIYAASFAVSGSWFDVGKPDSLFVFLCIASIATARSAQSANRIVFAGVLIGFAILAKQSAALVFAALTLSILLYSWRKAIVFTFSGALTIILPSMVIAVFEGRWYKYFVVDLLRQQQYISLSKRLFITNDLKEFWISALVSLAVLVPLARTKQFRWLLFYVPPSAALFIGAWVARFHDGGYLNTLMPAIVVIALFAGFGIGSLNAVRRLQPVAFLAIVLQLWFLRYNVHTQFPSAEQRSNVDNVIRIAHSYPGDVLVYSHPTYAVMAGKPSHASLGGSVDVLKATDPQSHKSLLDSVAGSIHRKQFSAILLDSDYDATIMFPPDWRDYYQIVPSSLVTDKKELQPVTGWGSLPRFVLVPK